MCQDKGTEPGADEPGLSTRSVEQRGFGAKH